MRSGKPTAAQINRYTSFDEIQAAMGHIFSDAQMTLSGHRKLVVLLRKAHIKAIELGYEESFNFHFTQLISKILKLKKGISSADRIAKFCSVFVAIVLKDEAENPTPRPESDDGMESDDSLESISSEFVDYLIRHLLRGIESRHREVRYRVVQLLAYLVSYITEIDEQLFTALRYSLNRRLYDKEAVVRIQAVVAISRFQYLEESEDPGLNSASKSLINALNHDDSPEVRRAALLNLIKAKKCIPELIKRARDVNPINRRLVFSRICKEIPSVMDIETGLRSDLLNWGLNDRDGSVKLATASMLTKTWLPQFGDDIMSFLENIQVLDNEVVAQSLKVIFEQKKERVISFEIPMDMWKELTVEKALFIRCYFEFCNQSNLFDSIDKNIPELTKLALLLQGYFKLRESMIDSNLELINEQLTHEGKVEKFVRLITNGEWEIREQTKKLERERMHIKFLDAHLEDLKQKDAARREKMREVEEERETSNRENSKDIIKELRLELKDITTELAEASTKIETHQSNIEDLEEKLEEIKKAQSHRLKEREKYFESCNELEERYQPFKDQLKDLDFVIEQMLHIIKDCDFADVAGTRRLMPVITNAMTNNDLKDTNLSLCVQILRKLSTDENYFSQLCTEIITDIRDSSLDEQEETLLSAEALLYNDDTGDFEDAREELSDDKESEDGGKEGRTSKRRKVTPTLPPDNLLIQCLTILQHYLEIAEDTSSNSYQLDTLIDTLIRPAITNNQNGKIRYLGYKTLGLFTLIDRGLGASNLKFFGISASKAQDETLKCLCMQIIFDIISKHGVGMLDDDGEDAVDSLSLARLFASLLKMHDMPKLQAVVAEGLSKLFLADLLADFGEGELDDGGEVVSQESKLLEVLLLSYFHPLNAENQELRQILAFCIPVYCFSHHEHQLKVSSVSGDCFYRLFRKDSEFADLECLASPSNVIQQLIYWCDPSNVVNKSQDSSDNNASHFWQAMKFLQVVEQSTTKAVKKVVIHSLGKLAIPESLGTDLLLGLKNAVEDTRQLISTNQDQPDFILDASTDRALERFSVHVDELVQKAERLRALERENTPVSFARSRTSSLSSQKGSIMNESVLKEEEEQEQESTTANPELEINSLKTNDVIESPSSYPSGDISTDLANIDKMLDEEERVDYEVDT